MATLSFKFPPTEQKLPIATRTLLLKQVPGITSSITFADGQKIADIMFAAGQRYLVALIEARAHDISVNGALVDLDYKPKDGDKIEII